MRLFLDLKSKEIGQIGGGKRKPNGKLDVAMIQSLARRDDVNDIVADYGHVIEYDEGVLDISDDDSF